MDRNGAGADGPAAGLPAFGPELRRLRVGQGVTQAALARAVHYSNAYVCKVESGKRLPTADLARRCDEILGTGGALAALLAAEADGGRRAGRQRRPTGPGAPRLGSRTAELPADVPDFTGRAGELAELDKLATATRAPAVAITGTAGVGKTALAVRWARRLAHRFPEGQIYLNLHGSAEAPPIRPAEALGRLLRSLGTPAERIPAEEEEAASHFRSLVADRRILFVLDNASSPEQVRPLLPGTRSGLAVITSRNDMAGLAASHSVPRLRLGVLTLKEAVNLLARLLGQARVAAERESTEELARLCSGLPLALRIAAARLLDDPARSIGAYADQMRAGDPFAALQVPGDEQAGVRAAFSLSYRALPAPAREMFRLLGVAPGPDVTRDAAAALAGTTPDSAAAWLARLESVHLVQQDLTGRFTMHDLLRSYAQNMWEAEDGPAAARARQRLFGFYVATADIASRLISPHSVRLPAAGPAGERRPEDCPGRFRDTAEAVAWFDAERHNLVAAARRASADGRREAAWLLADTMHGYFWLRRDRADWLAIAEAAWNAASAAGDGRSRASASWRLADAQFAAGRYEEAIAGYRRAADLAERSGWPQARGSVLGDLGRLFAERGMLDDAVRAYAESLRLAEESGSAASAAANLSNLGLAYFRLGRLGVAADHQERALAMHSQAGSALRVARTQQNLALIYHQQGRWEEAEEMIALALPGHREAADTVGEACSRNCLAALCCDLGRADDAGQQANRAIEIARRAGDRAVEADSLNRLGDVRAAQGRYQESLALFRQSAGLSTQVGDYPEVEALIGLARGYLGLGRPADAAGHARRAVELAERARFGVLRGQALTTEAEVLLGQGMPGASADRARAAMACQQCCGSLPGFARGLRALAEALSQAGRSAEAEQHAARARELLCQLAQRAT